MDNVQDRNRTLERRAWAAFSIWWEITALFQLPIGAWALGIGLLLIALNAARLLNGLTTSGFTVTAGILALVWGGLEMAGPVLNLPFVLPVFPVLLIALGASVLAGKLTEIVAGRLEA